MLTTLALLVLVADADAGVEPAPVDAGVAVPGGVLATLAAHVHVQAGMGKGVTIGAGEFELNLRGRVQVLFTSLVPMDPDFERYNAFAIRRARLLIRTKLPFHLSTTMQLAFARQDMELDEPNVLRDYYIEWRRFSNASVRLGQYKVPFDVQRQVSSSALQFPDRTIAVQELNMERDIGIALFSEDFLGLGERLRYTVAIMGGDGRNRIGTNVGMLYIARIAVSPLGKMDDKVEGDPDREHRLRFCIGGALARNVATVRQRSTAGTTFGLGAFDYTHATADFRIKGWGFSLLSEVLYRKADQDFHTDGTRTEWSRSGVGWFVQGGAYVIDWLELVARYSEVRPLPGTDPKLVRTRELGAGINFMVMKNDLKLQLDYAWLDDGNWQDGRHQLRAQVQVYF